MIYKIKVYPFVSGGFIQRDEYDQEEEFNQLAQLKKWIKNNCDLRHSVLTKTDFLDMHLNQLEQREFTEILMNKPSLAIIELHK